MYIYIYMFLCTPAKFLYVSFFIFLMFILYAICTNYVEDDEWLTDKQYAAFLHVKYNQSL